MQIAWRALALAAFVSGAVAQTASTPASDIPASETPEGNSNWAGYASLGASLIPEYEGASAYVLMPYVEGRLNYKNYYARFEGGALRFNVIDDEAFHAGPLIGFRRGRGNVYNAVRAFKHLDDTETAGGFVEWEHVADDPRSGETVYLAADNAVYGEKGGWQLTLRGTARRPIEVINPGFIVSLTGDVSWVSRPFARKYYGVTPADSAASGLAPYTPGDGFNRVGAALSVDQFLSRHFSIGARAYYGRMLGDAASSPVTVSSNQFFAGLVAGYVL